MQCILSKQNKKSVKNVSSINESANKSKKWQLKKKVTGHRDFLGLLMLAVV